MLSPEIKRNFFDLSAHLFFTSLFSVLIFLKTNNLVYVAVFICGGILIDLDHLIDYFLFFKKKFRLKHFLNHLYLNSGKVYLFFHTWELNLIIFLWALNTKSLGLYLLSISLSIHLMIDNIQRKNLLFYFFIYRYIKDFDVGILLPELRNRLSRYLHQ